MIGENGESQVAGTSSAKKRKRGITSTPSVSRPGSTSPSPDSAGDSERNGSTVPEEVVMTEEDYDIQHHKQITAQRNFDKVNFGEWQIKTW